jgi:peptidoglycan/LPS O-acetylase OafA/YrhL
MRITEIQTLRALAALLVVTYHAKVLPGGYIGVDIFYVISGYLITGLLLRELERSEVIALKAFFLRRVKRLLPASFFVLFITALVSWLLLPPTMRADLGRDIAAAGLYISNYFFALWQMDYQNLNATPPVVIHYWSLAVEEQFYLFWPFIIFWLYRRGGRSRVLMGIATITLLSFLLSLYMTENHPIWAFYSLPTRAWELGVGALILFIPNRIRFSSNYLWIALALLIYGSLRFTDSTPFPGTAALFPVVATALALAAVKSWPPVLKSFGDRRTVQWLGEISYPLYLWHWPFLIIPVLYLGRDLTIIERFTAVIATLLAAWFTHRFIEDPIRYAKFSPRLIFRSGITATVATLLLGSAIYLSQNDKVKLPDGSMYSLSEMRLRPIIYGDDCHANYGEPRSGSCIYGDVGSKRRLVLFGDSHAAQWFPALNKVAKEYGFELISLTKSACPAPAVLKVETGIYKNEDCFEWRDNSVERIRLLRPDAIIMSGFQQFQLPGRISRQDWWEDGQLMTANMFKGVNSKLIYISDTPHIKVDIPDCIAAGEFEKCNKSRPSPIYRVSALSIINPTPWLCEDRCDAVLDGLVAYRDNSHISVAMSKALAPEIGNALRRIGIITSS